MSSQISLQDYFNILNAAYELCQSYDTKDWDRLQKILAPKSFVDFRELKGELHDNLTPPQYAAILTGIIGDKRVKTQHLLGSGKWDFPSDGSVNVAWQIRVKHIRHEDETCTPSTAKSKGHGYGGQKHWYRKVDGVWKIEGVAPQVDWTEYDIYGTLAPQ